MHVAAVVALSARTCVSFQLDPNFLGTRATFFSSRHPWRLAVFDANDVSKTGL